MNQRIIITGASAGIGAELAVTLAKGGARLILAARTESALAEVVRRCQHAGGQAFALATDVADPEACRRLVEFAVEKLGGIDVLVNNAGISMWARFDEVTDLSVFEKVMKVNYLGAVYCTHFALPHLKRSRGLLVAVSSLTGKTGVPTRSGYAASKHAMQGFFDSLRIELLGSGVDVLIVSPGFVATDIRSRALGPEGIAHGQSPRDEGAGTMSVEECVRLIVEGMKKRKREVVMTRTAKVGLWLKLLAPSVVDRIAVRRLKERGQ